VQYIRVCKFHLTITYLLTEESYEMFVYSAFPIKVPMIDIFIYNIDVLNNTSFAIFNSSSILE